MMAGTQISPSVLVIEPDESVRQPYCFIPPFYQITRVTSTEAALEFFREVPVVPFESVWLSATFSPSKQLAILDQLKGLTQDRLVPLVMVVTWSSKNWLPQTTWGGQISVSHDLASEAEVIAITQRTTTSTKLKVE